MRSTPKDFEKAAAEAVVGELRAGEWPMYSRYDIAGAGEGAYVYAPPWWPDNSDPERLALYEAHRRDLEESHPHRPEFAAKLAACRLGIAVVPNPVKEKYLPLRYSDIFLEFAELVEQRPITQDVMLDWVRFYGVLGLEKFSSWGGWSNPRGGPAESVSNFRMHAQEANLVLRLFEAATKRGGPDVKFLQEHIMVVPELACLQKKITKSELAFLQKLVANPEVEYRENEAGQRVAYVKNKPVSPERLAILGEAITAALYTPEDLREMALDYVHQTVHMRVSTECYHKPARQEGKLRQDYGFKSLLGAMWQWMSWLTHADGDGVRYCQRPGCSRIVTFEQGEPAEEGMEKNRRGKYKTREDKYYCTNKCYQKHYYQTVIKPKRSRKRFGA